MITDMYKSYDIQSCHPFLENISKSYKDGWILL